jgi:hypothetical protein
MITKATSKANKIDLIVVAGQSNCAGFDTLAEDMTPEPIDKEIRFMFDVGRSPEYDNGLHNASSYAQWTTLRAQPNGVPRVENGEISGYTFRTMTGGFGPEISIARSLYTHGMTDLAVLKFAFASSCFADNHWNPGDELNEAFMSRYKQAVEKLREQGYAVRTTALFWHQGESDTGNPDYPEQFMTFCRTLRSTWGNANLPCITAVATPEYWLWTGDVTEEERKKRDPGIGAIHASIAAKDPHIHYVDDRGCARSQICGHYSSTGTLEIGNRMAKKFLTIYGVEK